MCTAFIPPAGALQLLGKMPGIHLFVVRIKSIQQQGTTLSPEIEKVMPDLLEKINNLVSQLISTVYRRE